MHFCPNPSCRRNIRQTRKPFANARSFSNHVQQSSECKVFVFDQSTTSATEQRHVQATPRSSINSTSQLFKKQRLRLNPTSMDCNVFTNVKSLGNHDQALPDADDNSSFLFDKDDQSISSHGSVVVNSCCDTSFDGTTKIPTDENDYACFTTSQKCVTSLMYLLDDMECPDYAFQSIMEWARNCFEAGFDFNPRSRTRLANLKWMYNSLHNSEQLLPSVVTIQLPDPLPTVKSMDVICYDFVPQLLSILQNKKMMSGNNLVLDPMNPLSMYKPSDNRLGESLSGSVYQSMYQRLVTNPSKQFLCPLICYTDGTQVDALSRFSVEPFLFTPAVLSHAARCKAEAWRPFGYVQHLRCHETKLDGGAKARNYHAQLQAMLQGLQRCQTGVDSRLQNVEIYLFGRCLRVDILCPILLIAADTPAADKLCGHYSSYGKGVKRVTCSCNVPFDKMDDPTFSCVPVNWNDMHRIATLGTQQECTAVSQHRCHNVFANIEIGDPLYKIFGSLPTDPMHSVRKGIMARAMSLIFDCMMPAQKYKLDQLAQTFHKSHRQSARKEFPQTDFSNGVTNLANMTASEECGLVFLLICLSHFDEGWGILNDALIHKGHKTNLSKVLEALEALSCFDAWTRLDTYWKLSQQKKYSLQAKESLNKMLTMIHDRLPRESGNGWKLPTFHNTMHIVNDMCKYGKPKEANTEVGEKNHKVFAKRIGRRCRKQHKTFARQVSLRLSDSFVIEKLANVMGLLSDKDDESPDPKSSTFGATHCCLHLIGNDVNVIWQSTTETNLLTWDAGVATFIQQNYMSSENKTKIHCCTEYRCNKLFMRCHPSYQGDGPWFDWVSVAFEACTIKKKKFPMGNYPCKVLAILPKERNSFLSETEVIVQCAGTKTKKDSVLFEEWTLMDGYYIVSASAILESLFVLELGSNKIAVALSYSKWPSCFTDTSSY